MKVKFKRFISSVLAVVVAASLLVIPAVPAVAADYEYVYSPSQSLWNQLVEGAVDALSDLTGSSFDSSDLPDFTFKSVGNVSADELFENCSYFNSVHGTFLTNYGLVGATLDLVFGGTCIPGYDEENKISRPMIAQTGQWVVDRDGNFPFYFGDGDEPAGEPSPSDPYVNNWWLPDELSKSVSVMSYDSLAEICHSLDAGGHPCRLVKTLRFGVYYWVIQDYSTDGGSNRIYGNSSAVAYVADGEESAKNNYYDYIVGDDAVINDSQIIDLENGTLNLIDDSGTKLQLTIDDLIFDTGSKNYTVNAYTTNYEGDNYYYTYYTYNITYNITNTYVTYIGSNDAYDREEYEYYYQLPDGRSSADLTADEVAGMSFEFHDVVNYARSATDVSVRALYHFDGNTNDSSYFSTQGEFRWKQGASITYMEAPSAFDGALYLDNTAHSFDIVLPSNMGSGDYTIQFRYYQASEPDTVSNIDNSIQIGGTYVLCWDEKTASRDPNGQYATWSLPVGTWNEIALVRNGGKLYVYLNGLCVSQESYSTVWNDTITFSLGSGSRAYSMIDELRVLNFALTSGGESYAPTAVPFDSNLVLVLPDSARPIADEYWDIKSSKTNLLSAYGLDNWSNFDITSNSAVTALTTNYFATGGNYGGYYWGSNYGSPFTRDHVEVYFWPVLTGINSSSSGMSLTSSRPSYNGSQFSPFYNRVGWGGDVIIGEMPCNGLIFIDYGHGSYGSSRTFSMVAADGSIGSLTATKRNESEFSRSYQYIDFNGYRISSGVARFGPDQNYVKSFFAVQPLSFDTPAPEFVYLELVDGSSTDLTAEHVTCVYPEATMQPNTAAVQSEIPVNGYTVGGVRPTLPSKGDVWFPVSENRIQTCYIYTGTMWEEVGCRWYTGSRWIPIYAFDLTTLEDLFDIADASTAIPPITSESAFWRWWQLQWLDFREYLDEKFNELISAISGKSSVSDIACKHDWVVTDQVNGGVGEYVFVDSLDECIDPSVQYVLPDGYIYAYSRVSVSRLPDGYTELAYIQSTGDQYIDTLFKPNNNTRIVLSAYNNSTSSGWMVGAWNSATSAAFAYGLATGFYYGANNVSVINSAVGDISLDLNKNAYVVNGQRGSLAAQTFSCSHNVYLFAINSAGGVSSGKFVGELYFCQIYDNGAFVRDYIPCINPDGAVGIIDIVNNEFYGNVGSGSFIAGPVVSNTEGRWVNTGVLYEADSSNGGYNILTCTACGAVARDYGNGPEFESSNFSFGDFLGLFASSVFEIATAALTEFIGLVADLIKMFIQAVMDFIGGFVGVLSDAAGHIATLGDSVAPIGDFVRGVYGAIPDPIEDVLTGSFVVIVAVSVISFLL